MCRNIKTLFNFEPPATEDEIHASALQFVRKLSGFSRPSQANEAAFDRAVEGGLVGLRRPAETGQLSHELQRRSADLVLCRGRLEIEQRLDVAAHFSSLPGAVRRPSKERSTEPKSYIDRANCHKVSGDVTLYAGSR